MLGWATTNTGGHNIALRKQIIAEQNRHGYKTMCIDASCFKYLDDTGTYLRYSLGGPFYDRAEYANKNSSSAKWNEIQQRLGIGMKPMRTSNGYILLGMQRDGGFAMKNLDPMAWAEQKVKHLSKITQRKILLRPHPGESKNLNFARFKTLGVKVTDANNRSLLEDLQGAHSAVFYNSSASVAAVCEGIPVFVDDRSAVTWAVANKDLNQIETPLQFEREQWLYDLASAHWSDDDASSGHIYQNFCLLSPTHDPVIFDLIQSNHTPIF